MRLKKGEMRGWRKKQSTSKFVPLDILRRELRRAWWPQCTYYVLPPLSDGNFILAFCFVMLMPTNFYPFLAIFLLKDVNCVIHNVYISSGSAEKFTNRVFKCQISSSGDD